MRLLTRLLAGLLTSVAAACGGGSDPGGVGTGGTGTLTTAGTGHDHDETISTTPRETVVVAPITGFGSVFVGGIRFDDSSSTITGDDGALARTDLKIGMMVEAQGVVTGATGSARSLRVFSAARGLVRGVDPTKNEIRLTGWRVTVDADTAFGNADRLSDIGVADYVEVFGLRDDGSAGIAATRVERRPSSASLPTTGRGIVHGVDPASGTFQIGELTVAYPAGSGERTPVAGDVVSYRGVQTSPGSQLAVASILIEQPSVPADGVQGKVEGIVSSYVTPGSFKVADTEVDASAAVVTPASADGISAGSRVQVTGTYRDGVLRASHVKVRKNADASAADTTGQPSTPSATPASGNGNVSNNGNNANATSASSNGNVNGNASGGGNSFGGNGNASTGNGQSVERTAVVLIGAIENYSNLARFSVWGQIVDASNATLSGRRHDQWSNGRLVEVRGATSGSIVVASKVHFTD